MQGTARQWLTSVHVWLLQVGLLLRNVVNVLRLRLHITDEAQCERFLIVTIRSFRHDRYGYQLLNYFSLAGYRIVFYRSLGFLCKLSGYDRMVFSLPGVLLWRRWMADKSRSYPWLRLGDKDGVRPSFQVSAIFRVDLDYFQEASGTGSFYLPYFVHPLLGKRLAMDMGGHTRIRRGRVLMYGQSDLPIDRARLEGYFGLIGRSEAFDALAASSLPCFAPDDFQGLLSWLHQPIVGHQLCLIDSRKVWIPLDRWLEVLSAFDCFIATPGYCMPHAHNLMEAMAVGTVPILQYHNHLHPPLVPGRNCLAFSGKTDLLKVVEKVLQMADEEIGMLRQGVQQYFSMHVDPRAVVPQLLRLAAENQDLRLFFNAEELSLAHLDRRMSAS